MFWRDSRRPSVLSFLPVPVFDSPMHCLSLNKSSVCSEFPVTTAWTHDLIASDDELFCGRPGTIGERAGNFTVQNSDVLLVLGSRLNIRQISYNWKSFARFAFKIQVDVDAAELDKPTVRPDLPIHCDLKVFLAEMARQLSAVKLRANMTPWLTWCRALRQKYPVVNEKQLEMDRRSIPTVS